MVVVDAKLTVSRCCHYNDGDEIDEKYNGPFKIGPLFKKIVCRVSFDNNTFFGKD